MQGWKCLYDAKRLILVSKNLFILIFDDVELRMFSCYRRGIAYYMHIFRVYLHGYVIKIRFSCANADHWLRKKSSKVLNPLAEGLKPSTGTFKTFGKRVLNLPLKVFN